MHVISKERAFLDKVVAIQKAFFRFSKKEGGGAEERDKFISRMRHLYDLKKLIDEKSVKELLVNLEAHLTEMLKTEPDEKCSVEEIKNSELFLEPEKVLQNFSQDWQRLKGMLYKSENLPTEGEIVEVLSKISKSL